MSSVQKSDIESWMGHVKRRKRGVPEGLWVRCDGCQATVFRKKIEEKQKIEVMQEKAKLKAKKSDILKKKTISKKKPLTTKKK